MSVWQMRRREQAGPKPSVPAGTAINPFPAAGSVAVGSANYPWPTTISNVRIVDATGTADATHSSNPIYTTVAAALTAAVAGNVIVMKAGTYRPSQIFNSKALTIQAAPGATVWWDGSTLQTGWTLNSGSVYRKAISLSFSHVNGNDATDPSFPAAPYPEMVLYDTTPGSGAGPVQMTQVLSLGALTAQGQFYYDPTGTMYIFGNPATWNVYVADLQWAFDTSAQLTMRGFGVRRYATSPNQFGCIRCTGNNSIFENMWLEDTSYEGLFFHNSTQTVTRCTFRRHGKAGLTAVQADNSVIEYSEFTNDDWNRFATDTEARGFKISNWVGLSSRFNLIQDNWGHGAWYDVAANNMIVYRNRIHRNLSNGLYHEISGTSTIVGNLITDNGFAGLGFGTAGTAHVWNNTIINNRNHAIYYESGNRCDANAETYLPVTCVVRNNILSGHGQSGDYLQKLRDWLGDRVWWLDSTPYRANGQGTCGLLTTVAGMNWTSDHNAYYRKSTGTTPGLALLVNGTGADLACTTVASVRSNTSAHGTQDVSSLEASGGTTDAFVDCTEYTYSGLGPMSGTTCIDPASTFVPIGALLVSTNKGLNLSSADQLFLGLASGVNPEIGALQI